MNARVLILEDNADDALLVVESLRGYGLDIVFRQTTHTGGFRELLREGWDVVLSDYNLPGACAEDALEIVKEHDENLPFILVSGMVNTAVAVNMMHSGANDFVLKDELERLGPAVERSIRESRHRREEKRALAALRTLQQNFQETLEQSAVGMTQADLQGRYTWVNRKFCEIVGRTRDELIGMSFSEITAPEDLERDTSGHRQALSEEVAEFNHNKRYLRPDGSPVWVDLTVTTIRRPDGELSHFATIVQDITEKKRAEARYSTIIETMAEGLFTLDNENRFTFANRRFGEMVGYGFAQLEGQNIVELLSFSEDRELINRMSERRLQGISDQYESRMKHQNGSTIHILISASPLRDGTERIVGKLCVVNDITDYKLQAEEQKQLRAQLDRVNRIESLGKLAGTMAHEFNNVLMGIQPFTEVIRLTAQRCGAAEGTCVESVHRATGQILKAVQRGRRVSEEVLRFARPTEPRREPVNVDDLMDEIQSLSGSLLSASHRVVTDDVSAPVTILADRNQIGQVFSNLLINANHAMADGGTIEVSAKRDDPKTNYGFGVVLHPENYVHFAVRDAGCGIPPEMIARVFEPLVTTKSNGTGLGLAVSHQIITSHGGLIFAESAVGSGTTIHVFLPLQNVDSIRDPGGAPADSSVPVN